MSLQSRRERRRGTRYTGVWHPERGRTGTTSEERTQQIEPRTAPVKWRLFSGTIVLTLSFLLVLFFTSDVFYVRGVSVAGLHYLTREEVFAFADIANLHIFWVSPDEVRDNLTRSPSIADAAVFISWPPNMVNIVIQEREPALVWEQAGTEVWLDVQGRMMEPREERDDLIRILANQVVDEGPLGESGRVDIDVIHGALQLHDLLPDVPGFTYDSVRGLGYVDGNGWTVWFGTGSNMAEKLQIYRQLAQDLQNRGIRPGEINIVDTDAPYYTVISGR